MYKLLISDIVVATVANLDTSDTGFSSEEEEGYNQYQISSNDASSPEESNNTCPSPSVSSIPVDKFSVRPRINNIYEQVLSNLPAIEDNPSVSLHLVTRKRG